MNYLDYKEISKTVLASGNVDGICYFLETANKLVDDRLKTFKYTHTDLSDDEHKQLLKLNNLNDDDVLVGGEVHRVMCDIKDKSHILMKVDEIELFTIMHQIDWIKTH